MHWVVGHMYTHCVHLPQRFHALSTFFQAGDLPLHSGTPLIWAVPPPINTHHSYSVNSESSKTSCNIKQWLSPSEPSLFHCSGLAETPVGEKTVTSALPCTFCCLGSWLLWLFLLQQGSGDFWEYFCFPFKNTQQGWRSATRWSILPSNRKPNYVTNKTFIF